MDAEIDLLRQRACEQILGASPATQQAEVAALALARSLRADGSWPDIDYASTARSDWEPCLHLPRVLDIAKAAERPGGSATDRATCLEAAHRALQFWQAHDFQCPNWWYNEIGVPDVSAQIALLMGDDLTPAEHAYITGVVLPRAKVGTMTGQNRVWVSGIGLMNGLLTNDDALVARAASIIADELRVSDTIGVEGIQRDWSFHQHGAQQQFGNYGLSYAGDMARWASILHGTRFAFSDEKRAILRDYLLDGQAWVTWRGMFDASACGRQLEPGAQAARARSLSTAMRVMASFDEAHRPAYDTAIARNWTHAANDLIGNRFFYRSDGLIHRTAEQMVSVKMHSSRVIGGESLNSENLAGALLADGATLIYRDGHEYADAFAAWDWRKVPGITAIAGDGPPKWPDGKQRSACDPFVGGTSDGTNGVACMQLDCDGLKVKKAWFAVGSTVVCLGADLHVPDGASAVTTLDQCRLRGDVKVGQGVASIGRASLNAAERTIEHDGVRYRLLDAQPATLTTGDRTGNWKTVFDTPTTPRADVTTPMFTLQIDHASASDGYAYAIEQASLQPAEVKILENDAHAQGVAIGDTLGVVFHTPGEIRAMVSVAVDHPCCVLLTRTPSAVQVNVADPTQLLDRLTVTIDGTPHLVALPQGTAAGSTVRVGTH